MLPPPVIGQRCIVPTSGSKLPGTPTGGYSSSPSPINGFIFTYVLLGRPLFWSLKYGQLCTPDGGTVNQVTLPVNTKQPKRLRNTTNAACIQRTQLASGYCTGHRRSWTAGPFCCYESTYISELVFLRRAQPLYRFKVLRALLCAIPR